MKCNMCDNESTVHCIWGLYEVQGKPRTEPMQEAKLCDKCSNDLWNTLKPYVNTGLMHWINKPIFCCFCGGTEQRFKREMKQVKVFECLKCGASELKIYKEFLS